MGDYTPPLAILPAWLSYSLSPLYTTLSTETIATLLPNGVPTLLPVLHTFTQYTTAIVQLPLTVEVGEGVPLGWPYTTAGGTGPTLASVLGATRGGEFTLGGGAVLAGQTTIGGESPLRMERCESARVADEEMRAGETVGTATRTTASPDAAVTTTIGRPSGPSCLSLLP